MAKATPDIRAVVDDFVSRLTEAIERQTLTVVHEALTGAGPASSRRGRGTRATLPGASRSAGAARAKGAKRSPEELERLTAELGSYIKSNPGQRIEQIAAGLGTSTKELNLPAKKLIADKAIKTKGHKRATQYFPR